MYLPEQKSLQFSPDVIPLGQGGSMRGGNVVPNQSGWLWVCVWCWGYFV